MITRAHHISRERAERLRGDRRGVVLSITNPGDPPAALQPGFREVVRVGFWDVVQDTWVDDALRRPIDEATALRMVEALARWQADPDPLVLVAHCEAGLSRSAAVVRFACERLGARGSWGGFANVAVYRGLLQAADRLGLGRAWPARPAATR